jgi:hypothetical protein
VTRRAVIGAAESSDARGAVVSSCISCGRYCAKGASRCHRCERLKPSRGTGAARERFRREVMARAGGRCECVEHGVRCPVTDPAQLEAHHVRAVIDGGGNDAARNGVLVCREHHAKLTAARLRAA